MGGVVLGCSGWSGFVSDSASLYRRRSCFLQVRWSSRWSSLVVANAETDKKREIAFLSKKLLVSQFVGVWAEIWFFDAGMMRSWWFHAFCSWLLLSFLWWMQRIFVLLIIDCNVNWQKWLCFFSLNGMVMLLPLFQKEKWQQRDETLEVVIWTSRSLRVNLYRKLAWIILYHMIFLGAFSCLRSYLNIVLGHLLSTWSAPIGMYFQFNACAFFLLMSLVNDGIQKLCQFVLLSYC